MSIKWWNENKMWLAPVAALIMWAVSVLCFVFGLSFKNPMGVMVGNVDISIVIAFALSISNTIIQLIGNGQDFEKMDGVFRIGWYSSYVLGIASNVNALLGILGINNIMLEWAVALSLGSMIEIMPEKLIVVWLKTQPTSKLQAPINQPKKPLNNPYRPELPKSLPRQQVNQKPVFHSVRPIPVAHSKPQPYPRESPYLNLVRGADEDDLGAMG